MALSGKQSRRLDEVVGTMATAMHPLMMDLVREFSDTAMEEKFGKVWDVAELHAAEARVYSVTEKDVARELDRKSVVEGTSGSGSVDIGSRRIHKKKKKR